MACELTTGGTIDCRDAIGGFKRALLSNFDNVSAYLAAGGLMSSITQVALKSFFAWNLEKENGVLNETQTGSIENGTNFYEGECIFTIKKLSAAHREEIRLMALSRLWIIIEDNNGKYFSFGAEFGADQLTSVATTGTAFGDLNGYTLTFSSKEKEPMIEIPQAVIDTLTIA